MVSDPDVQTALPEPERQYAKIESVTRFKVGSQLQYLDCSVWRAESDVDNFKNDDLFIHADGAFKLVHGQFGHKKAYPEWVHMARSMVARMLADMERVVKVEVSIIGHEGVVIYK